MKKLLFALVAVLAGMHAVPALAVDDIKPADPVQACKDKANFKYNFDMLKVEGKEIRGLISHEEADKLKSDRTSDFRDELKDCDDLKD
jgi:hypothetical protein